MLYSCILLQIWGALILNVLLNVSFIVLLIFIGNDMFFITI